MRQNQVFISYARLDGGETARELAAWLRSEGYRAWLDVEAGIPVGAPFDHRIEVGIRGSRCLIALITPSAVRPESFCRKEILFAQAYRIPIVPIRLVDVIPPIQIISLNYINALEGTEPIYRLLPELLIEVVEQGRSPVRRWPSVDGSRVWWPSLRRPSFEEEFARHGGRFVGRDWLFERIGRWILKPNARFLLLTGSPGTGKSAIAAQLTTRLDVRGAHFCSRTNRDSCRASAWVAQLVYQLAAQLESYRQVIDSLPPPEGDDAASLFRTYVSDPLRACEGTFSLDRSWTFVVDAIDESMPVEQGELINLLVDSIERFSPWFRVIATSRPDQAITPRFRLPGVQHEDLDRHDARNRADLHEYVQKQLDELAESGQVNRAGDLAERIVEKASGNFLFARVTLEALAEPDYRLEPEEIGELPRLLHGLYHNMFRKRFGVDSPDFGEKVVPLVDCLVVAREPISREFLLSATGLGCRAARWALRSVSPFLVESDSGVAFFHRSIAEWLLDSEASAEYASDEASGHEALAAAGWREFKAGHGGISEYPLAHLTFHLLQCNRIHDLSMVLPMCQGSCCLN